MASERLTSTEDYLEKRKRLLADLEADLPLAERRLEFLKQKIQDLRQEVAYLEGRDANQFLS